MARFIAATQPELAGLMDVLYEATAQPDLWTTALDKICDALGGAALISSLHRPGGMACVVSNRLDPEADKILREQYAKPETNPLLAAMPRIPVLLPVARESIMEDDSYLRSGLFNDVFRTQGFVHAGLSCLARERDGQIVIPCGVLRRTNREFDRDCFRVYKEVLPHLRRALELTVRFSDLRAARHHVEAVADASEDGYLVTDASARILYANAVAERMLSAGDGLSCRDGMLVAARHEETVGLHQLVSEAALRCGYLGGSMRLSCLKAEMPFALIVTPVPERFAGTVHVGSDYTAKALVRIIDLERKTTTPVARLRDLFGLSMAEAVIAEGLMKGQRAESIAEQRNLRITTVRTHIRSIYLKTETSRQTELVRLLLRTAGSPPSPE